MYAFGRTCNELHVHVSVRKKTVVPNVFHISDEDKGSGRVRVFLAFLRVG